ncbi:MAG TPA: helix-turn-helix transcriptional regulator [Candidatus Angelobacter sp.]|jgi:transcriptional regulator with XRE-family HTH domain|nr:helix-turn-helix transcriptional regulator [Candidatus Angelobacter sp.]
MTTGQTLREARTAAGLSQTELARRLGTTQSAVARAEGDGIEPSIAYIRRVAAATERPIDLRIMPPVPISEDEARRRWSAADGRAFDPWSRNPEPAEVRQLKRAGVRRG